MNEQRIRQRYFRDHNSFKRIAFDYQIKEEEIARICGVGLSVQKSDLQCNAEKNWFHDLPKSLRGLFQWSCDQVDISLAEFHQPRSGRGARAIVAWHLYERWGLSAVEIGGLLANSRANVANLVSQYQGKAICPIEPELPNVPADYLRLLADLAIAHGMTPLAICNGTRKHHRHVFHLFIGLLVNEHGCSKQDIAKALAIDIGTVQTYAEAGLQASKNDARRASRAHLMRAEGGQANAA